MSQKLDLFLAKNQLQRVDGQTVFTKMAKHLQQSPETLPKSPGTLGKQSRRRGGQHQGQMNVTNHRHKEMLSKADVELMMMKEELCVFPNSELLDHKQHQERQGPNQTTMRKKR